MRLIAVVCVALAAWMGARAAVFPPQQDVPEAVRRALERHTAGQKIEEIEREVEGGVVVYEASWRVDGRSHEVRLTEHGELLESEEAVPEAEVPDAVRQAAETRLGTRPTAYERKLVVVYEAAARVDGHEREVLMLPNGTVLEEDALEGEGHDDDEGDQDGDDDDGDDDEDGDDDDEGDDDGDGDDDEQAIALDKVPPVVVRAANAALPGALFVSAEVESKPSGLVYELSGSIGGEKVEIEIAADGTVLEIERG